MYDGRSHHDGCVTAVKVRAGFTTLVCLRDDGYWHGNRVAQEAESTARCEDEKPALRQVPLTPNGDGHDHRKRHLRMVVAMKPQPVTQFETTCSQLNKAARAESGAAWLDAIEQSFRMTAPRDMVWTATGEPTMLVSFDATLDEVKAAIEQLREGVRRE
jgi:hypothetical protein